MQTLVLVIDGSVVGRGGVALMIHVVYYKGRALPLAWVVRRGKKGHCPEALHGTVHSTLGNLANSSASLHVQLVGNLFIRQMQSDEIQTQYPNFQRLMMSRKNSLCQIIKTFVTARQALAEKAIYPFVDQVPSARS